MSEAYTLDTVARSPRMFKPKDVLNACDNLCVELKSGPAPQFIQPFAEWILRDYFALAHRTGLYNRQKSLWESISKIARVEISQKTVGIFKREPVPIYEFIFQDTKQKPLIFGLVVAGDPRPGEPISDKSDFVGVFKNFLADSRRMTTITGMFVCFAIEPLPEAVLKFLKKQTDSAHPVGRYEALIEGYAGPVNLVSCRLPAGTRDELPQLDMSPQSHPEETDAVENEPPKAEPIEFELIYPDLSRKPAGLTL